MAPASAPMESCLAGRHAGATPELIANPSKVRDCTYDTGHQECFLPLHDGGNRHARDNRIVQQSSRNPKCNPSRRAEDVPKSDSAISHEAITRRTRVLEIFLFSARVLWYLYSHCDYSHPNYLSRLSLLTIERRYVFPMEIKLKTTPVDENGQTLVDEYGALWNYLGPRAVHGIFMATTKGSDGEDIHGFFQNGILFIVTCSDAKNYFNSMSLMNHRGVRNI